MRIGEVCRQTGLTKKAIEYYEAQMLIKPTVLDNGYRDYQTRDIERLREISVLRACGIPVSEIKEILTSRERQCALLRQHHLRALQAERLAAQKRLLDQLIESYDIPKAFEELTAHGMDGLSIRERLLLAFPGWYGVFLSLHFGRFLNIAIETNVQRTAYHEILHFLDDLPTHISPELASFLENALFPLQQGDDLVSLEEKMQAEMDRLLADPDHYLAAHAQKTRDYLAFRNSEAFWQSEAGQVARYLQQFQKQSGYVDIFLENLKILSPDYKRYSEQLEKANERFLAVHPEAAHLYLTPDE